MTGRLTLCSSVIGLALCVSACSRSGDTPGAAMDVGDVGDLGETAAAGDPTDAIVRRALSPRESTAAAGPLFEALSPEHSGVAFQMRFPDPTRYIREFTLLSVYGGLCTGDFDGDELADFFVTSPVGGGRLFRNRGDLRFEDVTESTGLASRLDIWGTGASLVDIDNDGDLDLYVCAYRSPNRLFINQGRGAPAGGSQGSVAAPVRFEERGAEYGLDYRGASMTMAFADIDNDGDLDGYLATSGLAPPPGTSFQVRFEGNKPVIPERLKEYWALIYLPGDRAHRTEAGQYDHLFRNDGGRFVDVTREAGVDGPFITLAATWWDYNRDTYPDLYVSNDFLGPDVLYRNRGDGTFENVTRQVVPHTPWSSMGSDLGDVNNDGRVDFLATDMFATSHYREQIMMGNMHDTNWFLEVAEPRQYMRNALFLNSGVDRMMEAAFLAGLARSDWTWNPRLADLDNDGRLDLFVTTGALRDTMNADLTDQADGHFQPLSPGWVKFWAGQPLHEEPNLAFRNLGDLRFERVEAAWGLGRNGVSFGAATADFDNDGDLDLVVNNADAPVSVYRNRGERGHSLRVRLVGTRSNRFGVGALVTAHVGQERQVRYLLQTRGWLSACEPIAHFGLAEHELVDQLTVEWPSGAVQSFTQLRADHEYTITEPREVPRWKGPPPVTATAMFLRSPVLGDIRHVESEFDDFAAQPLLPHRLSQFGPAMVWGELNGDRRPDGFVGGSRGQPGQLLLSDGDSFSVTDKCFLNDAQAEDVAACLLDADADGDQDLYVVSGSHEAPPGDPSYRDRLYLNDGRGHLQRAVEALPDLRHSGSVAATGDLDQDGDLDLFVGSRCLPGQYPVAPQSTLLVNAGGKFVAGRLPDDLGMVTDAVWADLDHDGQLELLVATDWGPLKWLEVQGDECHQQPQPGLDEKLGWWTSLAVGDLDGDGDLDIVATNFGQNTKYQASDEQPEVLYYGDFDDTGQFHMVEAKRIGEATYPWRGWQCLQNTMPLLQQRLQSFHEFASSSLAEIYTEDVLHRVRLLEVNELRSGVFWNRAGDGFEFTPLPRIAQLAPAMDVAVADLNADAALDIVLAQNFYGPQPETGRMDGAVSLVLIGDGQGRFQPLWPAASGILVPGDARRVAVPDLNCDGRPDVVLAQNNGEVLTFINQNSQKNR